MKQFSIQTRQRTELIEITQEVQSIVREMQLKDGTVEEMKAILLTRSAEHWARWARENRLPLAVVR